MGVLIQTRNFHFPNCYIFKKTNYLHNNCSLEGKMKYFRRCYKCIWNQKYTFDTECFHCVF